MAYIAFRADSGFYSALLDCTVHTVQCANCTQIMQKLGCRFKFVQNFNWRPLWQGRNTLQPVWSPLLSSVWVWRYNTRETKREYGWQKYVVRRPHPQLVLFHWSQQLSGKPARRIARRKLIDTVPELFLVSVHMHELSWKPRRSNTLIKGTWHLHSHYEWHSWECSNKGTF